MKKQIFTSAVALVLVFSFFFAGSSVYAAGSSVSELGLIRHIFLIGRMNRMIGDMCARFGTRFFPVGICEEDVIPEPEAPFCGDGIVNTSDEQCDGEDGVSEGFHCTEACLLEEDEPAPFCGDKVVNKVEEECDGEDGVTEGFMCTDECLLVEEEQPIENFADHVVINEVYYDVDPADGTEGHNEWIELYNPTTSPVDLTGWMLSTNTLPTSTIPAMGFAFVTPGTGATSTEDFWSLPGGTEIIVLDRKISGNGLSNAGESLILKDDTDTEIDAISYGNNTSVFDPAALDVDEGKSLSRDSNGVDTDTAGDWVELENPTPGS